MDERQSPKEVGKASQSGAAASNLRGAAGAKAEYIRQAATQKAHDLQGAAQNQTQQLKGVVESAWTGAGVLAKSGMRQARLSSATTRPRQS